MVSYAGESHKLALSKSEFSRVHTSIRRATRAMVSLALFLSLFLTRRPGVEGECDARVRVEGGGYHASMHDDGASESGTTSRRKLNVYVRDSECGTGAHRWRVGMPTRVRSGGGGGGQAGR